MVVTDFDDTLKLLGTGRWNLIYYAAMSIAFFCMPSYVFSSSFLSPATPYSCNVPSINGSEITVINNNCSYVYFDVELGVNTTEKCSSWTFHQDDSIESLTSEFNLVCDRTYLRPTYQTSQMAGTWMGALLNGYLSDRFGRTSMLRVTVVTMITLTLMQTFIWNFMYILMIRVLVGISSSGIIQTGYIICMEITEAKKRSLIGIVMALPWAFGMMWWGVLGFFVRDWRWLQRVAIAPFLIVFILLLIMDESPRWLIVRGRHKTALKCLKRAAKLNKASLPGDTEMYEILDVMHKTTSGESQEADFDYNDQQSKTFEKIINALKKIFNLFQTPEIRRRTLLMTIVFIMTSTVYMGLSLNAVNFDLNSYMYMVVGGIMEIPAYTLIVPLISRFGRIKPTTISFFFCGFVILSLAFIPQDRKWVVIPLAMSGRLANAAAYQTIFLLVSEVYSTDVRIQALGTLRFLSTFSIVAPYITDLVGAIYPWMPSIVFGLFSFVAALATSFLPETLNKHLPETIWQLEKEHREAKNKRKFLNRTLDLDEKKQMLNLNNK